MPKGAIPQQFNGSTFYLVPLMTGNVTLRRTASATDAPSTPYPAVIGTGNTTTDWQIEPSTNCFVPKAK
jgi:hypothetical protein